MERYAVFNVDSGEIIGQWHPTKAEAHATAADCELSWSHNKCKVVQFSDWAPHRLLNLLTGDWRDVYPVVYDNNGHWLMTGEIVSAQETRYEITECGRGMFERES